MPRLMSVAYRFWSKVQIGTNEDCWVWQAASTADGYGWFKYEGRSVGAHRVAFELHHERALPPGMHVLHRCDNPPCVNPAHLFLGTNEENNADKMRKGRHPEYRKTHCVKGHAFNQVNTYITPRGTRQCRECNAERQRQYAARKKES